MFCRTPLWDGDLAWSATRPDLTECFHSTVPFIVPTIYLWIFTPYYIKLHLTTKVKDE